MLNAKGSFLKAGLSKHAEPASPVRTSPECGFLNGKATANAMAFDSPSDGQSLASLKLPAASLVALGLCSGPGLTSLGFMLSWPELISHGSSLSVESLCVAGCPKIEQSVCRSHCRFKCCTYWKRRWGKIQILEGGRRPRFVKPY